MSDIDDGRLTPEHLDMLRRGSAISDAVILARGARTITDPQELAALGFAPNQCRTPGLLLPAYTSDGTLGPPVFRPDNPRVDENRRKKLPDGTCPTKVIKYEYPAGAGMRLDCPPPCRAMLADPSVPLWITEGIKKGDALAAQGLCAIDLQGVWNFKGKNGLGGVTFSADFDYVALSGRTVHIVFDSDMRTNASVREAFARLQEHLQRKGAHVDAVYLPGGHNGKVGVDDFLAAGHTRQDLEALIEAPRPAPIAAAPRVELLAAPPPIMRRPLILIDGVAYAAIWPYCKVIRTEKLNSKGEVVTFNPPQVTYEQRLLVVRSDGRIFGEGGDATLDELGLEVILPEIPPTANLWRSPAVARYRRGERPDPADVFARVAAVVDHFIDFNRSLADQPVMTELVACYVLATWLLDTFNVIGFLWPNGEAGSGKTQLLQVTCAMAYLGLVVLAGGSYASLRDMADYGACLAFDDAENLANPKLTDPDKRTLLLAGNRRGSFVSVKEPAGNKTWRTRYVNTFCPRMFSAIAMPDAVLASRTIVVPLIRTANKTKANADPADYTTWPDDRGALVDDLWALGLAYLPHVGRFEADACAGARVHGRPLEPWRAILTVAKWLESCGVAGLYARLESLAHAYQQERPKVEGTNLTHLTLRALMDLFVNAEPCTTRTTCTTCTVNVGDTPRAKGEWPFTPTEVCNKVKELVEAEGGQVEWITADKVGRELALMRFQEARETTGKRRRFWIISVAQLAALAQAYGLELDPALASGPSGPSGTGGPSEPPTPAAPPVAAARDQPMVWREETW
jgi:hypothetical protein